MGLARHVLLWASRQEWLGEQFRKRAFAKRATARFIPGESVDEALDAAGKFAGEGLTSLVSRLGENVTTPGEADQVARHYLEVLDRIGNLGIPCHVSLKPTQLGLDISEAVCAGHLRNLLSRATDARSFIWVDMEGSAYVDRTLNLFENVRSDFENVGICVQAYLYRTGEDLERLIEGNAAVRLVKGAYSEPPEVAMPRKRDVDDNFLTLAARMLRAVRAGEGELPVFGTHDMRLLGSIFDEASVLGVDRSAYEIQMLYGIARAEQQELAAENHKMRVLISYGTAWFPWYMRRLAERPANVWFVLRSVFR